MSGRPVWLASLSYRKQNRARSIIPTAQWSPTTRRHSLSLARKIFGPLGNPDMERAFLMCATLCFHRGMTDGEIDNLPEGPGWLAGPPFDEILYESEGAPPAALSFQPCENRRYVKLDADKAAGKALRNAGARRTPLLLPMDDCGHCPSCLERESTITRVIEYSGEQT